MRKAGREGTKAELRETGTPATTLTNHQRSRRMCEGGCGGATRMSEEGAKGRERRKRGTAPATTLTNPQRRRGNGQCWCGGNDDKGEKDGRVKKGRREADRQAKEQKGGNG